MPKKIDDYSFLFHPLPEDDGSQASLFFTELRHSNVSCYRTKTIKSGDVLEVEVYPVWKTRAEYRRAKSQQSRETQKYLNAKNSAKNLTRKINANFTENDLRVDLTYSEELRPGDDRQAMRDIRNYIRRVRKWRKAEGLPELKYVYVYARGEKDGKEARPHFHVVMSGMDVRAAKSLWKLGAVNHADYLEPAGGSLEELSRYIIGQPRGKKGAGGNIRRWSCSKNLKKPVVTVSDTKVSKRRVEKLAADARAAGKEIFEKIYRQYFFDSCEVNVSDIVPGAYIYAKMHRPPPGPKKTLRRQRKAKHTAMESRV